MSTPWHELITVFAGFLASMFAVLRIALNQQRSLNERVLSLFDDLLRRQSEAVDGLREAVHHLSEGVCENSHALRTLQEWLGHSITEVAGPCH